MAEETKVILNLSDKVQQLLEEQQIDLYEELQQEIPAIRFKREIDSNAAEGTKDLALVLYGVALVIGSLSPIIIHVINRSTPPNRTVSWKTEIHETKNPDGSSTIQHIYVYSEDEQRPWTTAPYAKTQSLAPPKQLGQSAGTQTDK